MLTLDRRLDLRDGGIGDGAKSVARRVPHAAGIVRLCVGVRLRLTQAAEIVLDLIELVLRGVDGLRAQKVALAR